MSKLYTDVDFSARITEDRSWRLKEISDLKTATLRADQALSRVLLRALVTICYAHWEGYVKYAARTYLSYVALRKFQYGELNRQFLRNYFLPRLGALSSSKVSIAERCSLVDEILSSSDRRFSRLHDDLVNAKSNLNYETFSDICLVCGVDIDLFSAENTFIDVVLLKRRNEIAHGEDTLVSLSDLDILAETTISLMRNFGDALENLVYLKGYKAA